AKRYVASKIIADERENAVSHLPRRLVGESDRKDTAGTDILVPDEVSDSVRDYPSLAGARPRQDKQRPVGLLDGLALAWIEGLEDGAFNGRAHEENDTSVRVLTEEDEEGGRLGYWR